MQFIIEEDDGCKRIVYCITDRDRFDTYSYEMLRECEPRGLIVPKCTERNGLDAIQYDVSHYDTIRNYLSFSLSINQLISVFSQIVDIVQNLEEYLLDSSMLITDISHIYYDRDSKSVRMVYFPILFDEHRCRCEERVFNLFKEIIFSVKFLVGDNDRYIAELINALNSDNEYSISCLKGTVDRIRGCIEGTKVPVELSSYRHDNYIAEPSEPIGMVKEDALVYGAEESLSGEECEEEDFVRNDKKGIRSVVKRLFGRKVKEEKEIVNCEEAGFTAFKENDTDTIVIEEECDNETRVLMCGELGSHTPYLIRKCDGSRVDISKRVYKVGKDKRYADYVISNNAAISRAHAQFMIKDGRIFLTDEDSLNSTYVNNVRLKAGQETEVNDEDVIMFADEEYVLHC